MEEKMQEENLEEQELEFGTVAWFDNHKGIGFIEMDNGGKDKFVHWTQILMEGFKTLEAGQKVTFTIGANKNGPQAENVTVIKGE